MHHPSLRNLSLPIRVRLHLLTAVTVLFLSVYGKIVCPFIDTLSFSRLLFGLSLVYLFQVAAREWFYYQFPRSFFSVSLPRHGFHLSVLTWLLAGIVASLLHAYLYADFHWASHLKLLSGYWGLGAGILSQLEYVILEKHLRRTHPTSPSISHETITRRLMEGFAIFTVVPALMMILVSFRFVFEGYAERGAAFEVLFLGGSFVIAALFVSWRYGQALREDCNHLTTAVQTISDGSFHVNVDTSRSDELGKVAGGINIMAQGLLLRERIRDAFGRFVNPEVADSFIKNYSEEDTIIKMGGERRKVAILMADIRGFTPLSESLEPEELTRLLNSYFSVMVEVVQKHGGMVDKFIGDAIMVVFGLSDERSNPSLDGVRAALEMRKQLEIFNQSQSRQGMINLENGIGIHTGEVVAGYIGSADRLEFTVIGHAVNMAARIESQTKSPNPPILFSQTVADALQGELPVRLVTQADLKGISQSVKLFTVA
ncbi:MAG: HAMP domain-containing protein [Magnetococcales bacterium]|nr:HAMP domain-containing protein [Magnetococcales bacterium]